MEIENPNHFCFTQNNQSKEYIGNFNKQNLQQQNIIEKKDQFRNSNSTNYLSDSQQSSHQSQKTNDLTQKQNITNNSLILQKQQKQSIKNQNFNSHSDLNQNHLKQNLTIQNIQPKLPNSSKLLTSSQLELKLQPQQQQLQFVQKSLQQPSSDLYFQQKSFQNHLQNQQDKETIVNNINYMDQHQIASIYYKTFKNFLKKWKNKQYQKQKSQCPQRILQIWNDFEQQQDEEFKILQFNIFDEIQRCNDYLQINYSQPTFICKSYNFIYQIINSLMEFIQDDNQQLINTYGKLKFKRRLKLKYYYFFKPFLVHLLPVVKCSWTNKFILFLIIIISRINEGYLNFFKIQIFPSVNIINNLAQILKFENKINKYNKYKGIINSFSNKSYQNLQNLQQDIKDDLIKSQNSIQDIVCQKTQIIMSGKGKNQQKQQQEKLSINRSQKKLQNKQKSLSQSSKDDLQQLNESFQNNKPSKQQFKYKDINLINNKSFNEQNLSQSNKTQVQFQFDANNSVISSATELDNISKFKLNLYKKNQRTYSTTNVSTMDQSKQSKFGSIEISSSVLQIKSIKQQNGQLSEDFQFQGQIQNETKTKKQQKHKRSASCKNDHELNKDKPKYVQVRIKQNHQKQVTQNKPNYLINKDIFDEKSSNKQQTNLKESQQKIITNKGENQTQQTNSYTRPSTQNKKLSTNYISGLYKFEKKINGNKKYFSDSQSQDQFAFIQTDFNIVKKQKINNYLKKGKLQSSYTKIFYKDQTLKNIQSVNQLKQPFNANKHQKQRKAERANKNIKQTSQMILKDKKYPKKDLYLPTLQQVRIFDKTYQNDIQKKLLKMKKEIDQSKKGLESLKGPFKQQFQKNKTQLQSQKQKIKTFYTKNLKPQINKINLQSKKYLFEEFFQNFTTVQTQLYEFFQFNSNIIIKNKELKNNQKKIKQPREYFKLIEKQLKSKQNKKTSYRQQSNKYNVDRFKNDNIEIKNWQKMKKYFQNPTQQYQKKFKFLISPILNRNVYSWNKVYNKLEKKFQIDKHIQQFQQTSVIKLPVNMYSLSYVVMVCLQITEKKQLLSQIEDLRGMSERIVENIFEKPKDKELKMENQLKDQIKYNEMLSKQDILLEEQITKKRKMYELELETWMLLVKFVQELIKKIIKIEYRQDYTRRKVAQKFLIDFIETFYLYNFVVSVYENQYGKMLDFNYFISLINRQSQRQNYQNYSLIDTKLNIFWQSFFYIQLVEQTQKYQIAYLQQKGNSHYRLNVLKFVYMRCISEELVPQSQLIKKVKQVKQINQIKQLKLKVQTKKLPQPKYFNFWLFYNDIYPIKSQDDMIELETKYIVHFSQYCQQIIAELSQAKNISLDVVFNSIRFLQINLILHFTNLCFDEIQRSIWKSCGRLHKKKFIQYRNKNDKWIDCTNKSMKAIDLAYKKLLTYIQQITNAQKLRQSANVQKIKKMLQEQQEMMSVFLAFNIDTSKVRSIERIEHLSGEQKIMSVKHIFNQNVDRDQQLFKYLKKNYNQYNLAKRYENVKTIRQFQQVENRPKYLYRFIIEQLGKEYFSTKIMQKTFKKLLKKHLGEQAAKTYDFKKYSKNLKFIYVQEQKNNKKGTPKFRIDFDKFQKQWVISIIQTIKVSSLVVTLPFYSFQTQRENQRIRYGRIFNNDLRRKQPKKLLQIMKTLDLFYIYKAERLNTTYMQRNQSTFDEILQIKLKYLKYTKRISQFFQQLRQTSFSAYSTQFEPVKDFRYIQELQLVQPTPIQSIPYNESSTAIYSIQDCDSLLQLQVQPIQRKLRALQGKDNKIQQKRKYQILGDQRFDQFCEKVFQKKISPIFNVIFKKGVMFFQYNKSKQNLKNRQKIKQKEQLKEFKEELQYQELTSIYLKFFKRPVTQLNSYIFRQKSQIQSFKQIKDIKYQKIFEIGVKLLYNDIIQANNGQQQKNIQSFEFIYQKSCLQSNSTTASQTQSIQQNQSQKSSKLVKYRKQYFEQFKNFVKNIKNIKNQNNNRKQQIDYDFQDQQTQETYNTGASSSYMSLGSLWKRKDQISITRLRIPSNSFSSFQNSKFSFNWSTSPISNSLCFSTSNDSTIDTIVYAQHKIRQIGKQNFLIFNQSISLSIYQIIKSYLYQNQDFQCNVRLAWLQRYNEILPQQIQDGLATINQDDQIKYKKGSSNKYGQDQQDQDPPSSKKKIGGF